MKKSTKVSGSGTPKRTTRKPSQTDDLAGILRTLLADPATTPETIESIATIARGVAAEKATAFPLVNECGQPFSPKIEARREGYARLAQLICGMLEFEYHQAGGRGLCIHADEPTSERTNHNHFMTAIREHIMAVIDYISLENSPEAIARFYVELRLFGDQMAADHEALRDHYARLQVAETATPATAS